MSRKNSRPSLDSAIKYLARQSYSYESSLGSKLLNDRLRFAKNLYNKDLYAHYGCVNAVEFSKNGQWLVSGGDDKRILVWSIDQCISDRSPKPRAMKGEHNSNIFCLSFDSRHQKIFSAGNDEQVILHDMPTGETVDVFLHDEAVYGLSVDPENDSIFVSACDDGRLQIWDTRASSSDPFTLANSSSAFHAVMYNPSEPRLIVAANSKDGVTLWDVRRPPVALLKYGGSLMSQSAMSVRFNSSGNLILALRRRLPPVLFQLNSVYAAAEFDHREYYNSCTMKTCCFAGENDEYVVSGSDDFKLYLWKIPDNIHSVKGQWINDAHLVLKSHRSIVNQVRFNDAYGILASSGVEKVIKLWSTFPLKEMAESSYVMRKDHLRKVFSHEEYISLVLESGQFLTHDYSHHSVKEDPRMMAFFDSLVQRDIEGWTSSSSETSTTANVSQTCFEVQSPESSSSSSTISSSSESESELWFLHQNRIKRSWISIMNDIPLLNIRTRPTNVSIDPNHLSGSLATEKISELIAKKRKNQNYRSSKIRLKKQKRHSKKSRKENREKKSASASSTVTNGDASVPQVSSSSKTVNSVLPWSKQGKQQMQLLHKMRAKLLRTYPISGGSSDSDVESATNTTEIPDAKNSVVPSSQNLNSEETHNNLAINSQNGEISGSETLENNLPVSSNGNVNGESANQAKTMFPPKTSKKKSRNYRKRSAEDMQDE